MKDETIIRLCEETTKLLSQTVTVNPAGHMVPSYNATLTMARENHPAHPFLRALQPLAQDLDDAPTVAEIMALFAQIRIVLTSLHEAA